MSDHISVDESERCFTATYIGAEVQTNGEKVVFGVDFGTTYMGISKVYPDDPSTVFCGAPASKRTLKDQVKVPTVALKTPKRWYFGNEALAQYNAEISECDFDDTVSPSEMLGRKGIYIFKHFKMRLKDRETGMETLRVEAQNSTYTHSLMDVIRRCLEYLSKYAMNLLNSGYFRGSHIAKSEIRWVVTVPAIWNDFGKAFMRRAAYKAGMIETEHSSNLLLALEPESAALAVHGEGSSLGFFKEGESFLVVDCGGGTVDTTPLLVSSSEPLVLDGLSPPSGGAWGSIFVEYSFREFLERLFGKDKFEKLKYRCPGELAEIMEEFRTLKEEFDPASDAAIQISLRPILHQDIMDEFDIRPLPELVEEFHSCEPRYKLHFDLTTKVARKKLKRDSILTLTKDQMLSFFEYSHSNVCDCVQATLRSHPDVRTLVLVGGGASSKALQARVREEFEKAPYNVKVIVPDRSMVPQAAVVQGAAYYGLYTSVFEKRFPKFTYGIQKSQRWTGGCGIPESEAVYDARLGEMRVHDVFVPIVRKGSPVQPTDTFRSGGYRRLYPDTRKLAFKVFASASSNPRRTTYGDCWQLGKITVPCTDDDTFDVEFTFNSEMRVEVIRSDGRREFTTVKFE